MSEQPAEAPVPAEFEPHTPVGLTGEEIAEFRALREEKKKKDEEAAQAAEEAAAQLQPHTHYVHLGDGKIVDGSTIATHVDNGDGPVPVAGTYLKPEFVSI